MFYIICDEYHDGNMICKSYSLLFRDISFALRKLKSLWRSSNKYHIYYLLKVDTSSLECVA